MKLEESFFFVCVVLNVAEVIAYFCLLFLVLNLFITNSGEQTCFLPDPPFCSLLFRNFLEWPVMFLKTSVLTHLDIMTAFHLARVTVRIFISFGHFPGGKILHGLAVLVFSVVWSNRAIMYMFLLYIACSQTLCRNLSNSWVYPRSRKMNSNQMRFQGLLRWSCKWQVWNRRRKAKRTLFA